MELFIMDENEEMTGETLNGFLTKHRLRLTRYKRLEDLYKGNHKILRQEDKSEGKPDNRLVVNFAKYIVDTLNGYFMGNPVKTVHDDEKVAKRMRTIAKRNSQNDNNAELSKLCSIYGHAYEYLYQDDEANTRVTYIEPRNAFVIYDDTVAQEPLYGVYIKRITKDGKFAGVLYTTTESINFDTDDDGVVVLNDKDSKEHYYGDVPIIEYLENEERQAAFENVETLINAYNKAMSEKANDVDYFADAYLAILGVKLDEDTIKEIRDNRVINLKDGSVNNITVEFLDKPNADQTQENLINRLERLTFQISMVSNINDDTFGTSSGIALKYKLQSMENLTLMKERKFNNGMMRRFKMLFNVPTNFGVDKEEYLNIDYVFSRNVPNDLLDEADAAGKLAGIVSKSTQLSVLSMVDNVQEELDKIEEERSEQDTNSFNKDMNMPLIRNPMPEMGRQGD